MVCEECTPITVQTSSDCPFLLVISAPAIWEVLQVFSNKNSFLIHAFRLFSILFKPVFCRVDDYVSLDKDYAFWSQLDGELLLKLGILAGIRNLKQYLITKIVWFTWYIIKRVNGLEIKPKRFSKKKNQGFQNTLFFLPCFFNYNFLKKVFFLSINFVQTVFFFFFTWK